MGDAGTITGDNGLKAAVSDTAKPLGRVHAHRAAIEAGTIKVGDSVHLAIDTERRAQIRANHSATHRSEEHTSELQSLMRISYDVFCLKKKKQQKKTNTNRYT